MYDYFWPSGLVLNKVSGKIRLILDQMDSAWTKWLVIWNGSNESN